MTYREVCDHPMEKLAIAVKQIIPRIEMGQIEELVENIPELSSLRKEYIITSIKMQYEQILCRTMWNL